MNVPPRLIEFVRSKRLPIAVAVASGVLALTLLQDERARWRAAAGEGPQQRFLVISRATPKDTPLQKQWLEARPMPAQYVHPLALTEEDLDLVAGAVAARPLRTNQPLLWSDLAESAAQHGDLSSLVRPTERAVSLRMHDAGLGPFLRTNDHIDIFATFDSRHDATMTVPVLQNVTVLSARDHGNSSERRISVSVSPQEAALLTLAQETGRLTYVLRNGHDWETVPELKSVSLDDLFEDSKRKEVQQVRDIRVVRGKL